MKALREVRPPGIYPIGFESRITPITIADAHVAGFVGIASKGPRGAQPTRCKMSVAQKTIVTRIGAGGASRACALR